MSTKDQVVIQAIVTEQDELKTTRGSTRLALFNPDGTPVDLSGGEGGTVDWDSIEDKPEEFAPEAHTHAIADVTGLQAIINDLTSRIETLESA